MTCVDHGIIRAGVPNRDPTPDRIRAGRRSAPWHVALPSTGADGQSRHRWLWGCRSQCRGTGRGSAGLGDRCACNGGRRLRSRLRQHMRAAGEVMPGGPKPPLDMALQRVDLSCTIKMAADQDTCRKLGHTGNQNSGMHRWHWRLKRVQAD